MLAIASDHAGFKLKTIICEYLTELGYEYHDYGTYDLSSCHYPEYAHAAATAVASGECEKGILICGTGIGMSIAANKVDGIRCAAVSEPYSAMMSRAHNDANMLAFGERVVGDGLAKIIVKTWLETPYEGGRHQIRVDEIENIQNSGDPLKK